MIRGFVVGAGAAVVIAATPGCYVNTAHRVIGAPPSSSTAPAVPAPDTGSAATGAAAVNIDGWPRAIRGYVACTRSAGDFSIAVGEQDTGIAVLMSPDASKVSAVELGEVYGVLMGYRDGAPGGHATATKRGPTYTITGTATGVRVADLSDPIIRPFKIIVRCPARA